MRPRQTNSEKCINFLWAPNLAEACEKSVFNLHEQFITERLKTLLSIF